MNGWELPAGLPEWNGAEDLARNINAEKLYSTVRSLIDLVLADDYVVLDSLPSKLESALITPLSILASVYEEGGSLVEIIVSARLVRRSSIPYLDGAPNEVAELIRALPD